MTTLAPPKSPKPRFVDPKVPTPERGQKYKFADGRIGVVASSARGAEYGGVVVYVGPQSFTVPPSDVPLVFGAAKWLNAPTAEPWRGVGGEQVTVYVSEDRGSSVTGRVSTINVDSQLAYIVHLTSDEDGYVATCNSFAGCTTQGKTRDEALRNVCEAIELCLETAPAEKTAPPEPAPVAPPPNVDALSVVRRHDPVEQDEPAEEAPPRVVVTPLDADEETPGAWPDEVPPEPEPIVDMQTVFGAAAQRATRPPMGPPPADLAVDDPSPQQTPAPSQAPASRGRGRQRKGKA